MLHPLTNGHGDRPPNAYGTIRQQTVGLAVGLHQEEEGCSPSLPPSSLVPAISVPSSNSTGLFLAGPTMPLPRNSCSPQVSPSSVLRLR